MEQGSRLVTISNRIYIGVLLVTSTLLCWFCMQLTFLGGSGYYILAGSALACITYVAWMGARRALFLYGLLLLATLVSSVWEAGPDGWALPATYWSEKSDRQFVVITGGHPWAP